MKHIITVIEIGLHRGNIKKHGLMSQFSNWINLLILEAQGLEREARKDNAAPSIERPQRAPAKTPATQPRRPTCAERGRFIEGRFQSVPVGSDRFGWDLVDEAAQEEKPEKEEVVP